MWHYMRKQVGETSLDGVYAGGDAATGAATVISAMGAGKRAAKPCEYLTTTNNPFALRSIPVLKAHTISFRL
jgi:NADPH-dependent glutamate synthase beta subunit-like oxidoreductase